MSEAIYDIEEQWQAVEAGLLEGEQLVAVYDAKDAGTGFIGLTDLRVVLQDESYVGGRVALTSIPYGGVHAVSLVANKSFLGGYVEAATVSIGISGHTYEVELRGHDKARHVHDVMIRHRKRLDHLNMAEREDTLCEMNVIEQVGNVALTNVIQDAWARSQKITVHGWCYGLKDGLVKDLGVSMSNPAEVMAMFRTALKRYPRGASTGR